mmetsp:Transcript_14247/g.23716  ORF Transcript_14247/g.23716 Transcript_14247/m.23716 type:complete len:221 (-) Transcript_14247:144-806(-)
MGEKTRTPIGSPEMKVHDMFNIVTLCFICTLDVAYLVLATDFAKLGTNRLGEGYEILSVVLLALFSVYLVMDLVWVLVVPKCVASSPIGIIIHHLACLLLIAVPWAIRQFAWHSAINLSVEINTIFLTARRNVKQGTAAYHIFNVGFYLTWFGQRLILFPILVGFFYQEWIRYSEEIQTPYNLIIIAVILELFITTLSFKWTLDMVIKMFRKSKPVKQAA